MFANNVEPTPIMEGGKLVGLSITGTSGQVADSLADDYDAFNLKMYGDLTMLDGGSGPDDMSGTITSIDIYHMEDGGNSPLIASNSGLSIAWSDLMANMEKSGGGHGSGSGFGSGSGSGCGLGAAHP